MRQTVTPIGLVTQPNEYGQYPPGALRSAVNCVMRRPGVIEPMPYITTWDEDAGGGNTIYRVVGGLDDDALLAATDNDLRWVSNNSTTAITVAHTGDPTFSTGKFAAIKHRDKIFATCNEGVLEVEAPGTDTAALAGFPAVLSFTVTNSSTTAASALPNNKDAAYKVVVARKDSTGGYERISPPTYGSIVQNIATGSTYDPIFRVSFGGALEAELVAGDVIEIYRTETVDTGSAPGNVYYRVVEYEIASGDITAGYADVRDTSANAVGGRELYTNPGQPSAQQGPQNPKLPPPLAEDIALYGGYTVYVAPKLAGYVERRIPGLCGTLSSAAERTYGIGTRAVTGDFSSGTNTILNVNDTTGLVVGQRVYDGTTNIPANTYITNISGTTVTMDNNAIGTGSTQSFTAIDRIEINGVEIDFGNPSDLAPLFSFDTETVVTFNQQVYDNAVSDQITGLEFRLTSPWYYYGAPTIRATNGQNFSPELPEIDETAETGVEDERYNRLLISLLDQPAACPLSRELLVGNGTIHRVVALRDAFLVFASDGLWRVTGDANRIADLRVDLVDNNLFLVGRGAVDSLHDTVFAYTNRGFVAVTPDGSVVELSDGVVGDQMPGSEYRDTWTATVACDDNAQEVWVCESDIINLAYVGMVFNARRKAFTSFDPNMARSDSNGTQVQSLAYFHGQRGMAFVVGLDSVTVDDVAYHDVDNIRRTTGCSLDFQPLLGDGGPNTLKEWQDVTFNFSDILTTAAQTEVAMGVVPRFNESALQDATPADIVGYVAANGEGKESRMTAAVPADAPALASQILPGFAVDSYDNRNWEFKGLSMRWTPAGDEETTGDEGPP